MTQDDLPPGPWSVGWEDTADGPEWFVEHTNSHTTIAYGLESEPIARAIAAIPEMRAQIGSLKSEIDWHCEEINLLRSEMDYNVSIRERLKLLEDSNRDLRAERAAIEAATIERCAKLADAHDPFEGGTEMPVGDAIRALAKENETDPRNTADLLREAATRIRKLESELDRLRAEKTELIEMLATRTTHPEYVEVLRRYRPANETERK